MGTPSNSTLCPRALQPGLEYTSKDMGQPQLSGQPMPGHHFSLLCLPLSCHYSPVQEPFPSPPLEVLKGRYKPSRSLPGRLDRMISEAFSNPGDSIVLLQAQQARPSTSPHSGADRACSPTRGLAACGSSEAAPGPPPRRTAPVAAVGGPRRHSVDVHGRLHAQHRLVVLLHGSQHDGRAPAPLWYRPPRGGERGGGEALPVSAERRASQLRPLAGGRCAAFSGRSESPGHAPRARLSLNHLKILLKTLRKDSVPLLLLSSASPTASPHTTEHGMQPSAKTLQSSPTPKHYKIDPNFFSHPLGLEVLLPHPTTPGLGAQRGQTSSQSRWASLRVPPTLPRPAPDDGIPRSDEPEPRREKSLNTFI